MYDDEVTVLVEKATSPMLFAADWEANLACVDAVLANDDGPEVAVDTIREKFESDNENVVVLAIELLDCLLKNVYEVIELVGQREVMDEIMKIAEGKKRKAAERALDFIQYFADAFKMIPLLYYGYAFNQLAQRGHRFPPPREEEYVMPKKRGARISAQEEQDLAMAAALSAEEARKAAQAKQTASRAAGSSSSGQISTSKLKEKLEGIQENIVLVREMLGSLGPKERPQENELFQELVPKLKDFQKYLVKVVETSGGDLPESILGLVLATNDSLEEVLKLYDTAVEKTFGDPSRLDERTKSKLKHDPRFAILPPLDAKLPEKSPNQQPSSSNSVSQKPKPVPAAPAAPAKPTAAKQPPNLEDLLFGGSQQSELNAASTKKGAAPANEDPFDEFAALASRKRPDSGTFVVPPTSATVAPAPSVVSQPIASQPVASFNPFDMFTAAVPAPAQPAVPQQTVAPNPFADLLAQPLAPTAPVQLSSASNPQSSASKPAATANDLIQW
eukprot:TRINITY_DN15379_c0_g1_i1.p1 TRINITY_DN15379_c0_g1~~TRINITY_DN15379_c0_g1_i1.p1  ORF type:complete len:511 (+),score=141.44 TRINITY_DN15379_c0_g1_i1:26-1534(+)